MSFFDVTEHDLDADKDLVFTNGQIVKFQCIDHRENNQKGTLTLKCLVLQGDHEGKVASIFISKRDHEAAKKVLAQFMKAFWTRDELLQRNANLSKLLGRVFTVKSRTSQPKPGSDVIYQNWEGFQDLGAGTIPEQYAQQAAGSTESGATHDAPSAAQLAAGATF